ncbi:MAG TPA: hypothetical protein VIA18_12200 [Polyangia bacterium]|jgi:hypothetical protein|nr:hypothetical protein [Polyangia bacterium]
MDAISFNVLCNTLSAATDVGLHEWLLAFLRASGLVVVALLFVRAIRRALRSFAPALAAGRRALARRDAHELARARHVAWAHAHDVVRPRAAQIEAARLAWARAKRAARAHTTAWRGAFSDGAGANVFARESFVPA